MMKTTTAREWFVAEAPHTGQPVSFVACQTISTEGEFDILKLVTFAIVRLRFLAFIDRL